MASTSETGHAKNVANFESLITSIASFGTNYNPSKESIKLPAMQHQLSSAQGALNAVNNALATYSNAVATREAAFEPFGRLITRINNALKASDSTPLIDDSA